MFSWLSHLLRGVRGTGEPHKLSQSECDSRPRYQFKPGEFIPFPKNKESRKAMEDLIQQLTTTDTALREAIEGRKRDNWNAEAREERIKIDTENLRRHLEVADLQIKEFINILPQCCKTPVATPWNNVNASDLRAFLASETGQTLIDRARALEYAESVRACKADPSDPHGELHPQRAAGFSDAITWLLSLSRAVPDNTEFSETEHDGPLSRTEAITTH